MIKVFCDRCGNEIADAIQKEIQYFLPVSETEGRDGAHFCPSCKAEFVQWFRGEKKVARSENPELKELEKFALSLGLAEEDLDEAIHEMKGEEASGINNSGMMAQLEYLLEGYKTVEALKEYLKGIFS